MQKMQVWALLSATYLFFAYDGLKEKIFPSFLFTITK